MSLEADTEARQALDAVGEVRRRLSGRGKPDWGAILGLMEPYRERRYLHGTTRENANRILSLVNAVMGDAHRELGDPGEAAAAYGRAQDFYPGTGFQDFYAELVLKHRLEDHYEKALAALLDGQEVWATRSPILRLVGHIGSLLGSPGTYWHFLRSRILYRCRVRKLRALIEARSAPGRGQ
jgi:hypothetical protein